VPSPEQLREVAKALRELQITSPVDASGIDAWSAEARRFTARVHSQHPDLSLPSDVMFYLHDADVRTKDAEVRAKQNEALDRIIQCLEFGNVPASRTNSVAIDLRVLMAALIAGGLLIWLFMR
jgi:hypothetical protein